MWNTSDLHSFAGRVSAAGGGGEGRGERERKERGEAVCGFESIEAVRKS
jgi:hypothetical protein